MVFYFTLENAGGGQEDKADTVTGGGGGGGASIRAVRHMRVPLFFYYYTHKGKHKPHSRSLNSHVSAWPFHWACPCKHRRRERGAVSWTVHKMSPETWLWFSYMLPPRRAPEDKNKSADCKNSISLPLPAEMPPTQIRKKSADLTFSFTACVSVCVQTENLLLDRFHCVFYPPRH